jgi:hypothetical protein
LQCSLLKQGRYRGETKEIEKAPHTLASTARFRRLGRRDVVDRWIKFTFLCGCFILLRRSVRFAPGAALDKCTRLVHFGFNYLTTRSGVLLLAVVFHESIQDAITLFPPSVVNRFLTLIFRDAAPSLFIPISPPGPLLRPIIALGGKSNASPALSFTISRKICRALSPLASLVSSLFDSIPSMLAKSGFLLDQVRSCGG